MLGRIAQPLAKDLGKRSFCNCCGGQQADCGVKFTGAVVGDRIGFSQFIALAFFGDYVQKLRAF